MIYEYLMFHSCTGYQSSESVTGGAAGHRCTTRVLCGGLPQHHQLLGQESWGNVAKWVSAHISKIYYVELKY